MLSIFFIAYLSVYLIIYDLIHSNITCFIICIFISSCKGSWFSINHLIALNSRSSKLYYYIMRGVQNLSISWEINFYVKSTCKGKVITKKNVSAHKNSSGPYYRAIKSKVIFRSVFR